MTMKNKKLRSGYTTGACAAAAAKAAASLLLRKVGTACNAASGDTVEIPFPDGSRVRFAIHESTYDAERRIARASVIKDAGDDPDITDKAEIGAEASLLERPEPCAANALAPGLEQAEHLQNADNSIEHVKHERNAISEIIIKGGRGVGVVTKPGLAVPVGEAAINPVPRKTINDAVREAVAECGLEIGCNPSLEITISIPDGERLARKTLNNRLGIVGGLSVLGTTGIVKPVSAEAWTATITASMDVARATGHDKIVLSSGRTSEKAHQNKFGFPEECYAMMGDYLEFSLLEAKRHEFREIHISAQWAKMLKTAMSTPQTHVRHGAIGPDRTAVFLTQLGVKIPGYGPEKSPGKVVEGVAADAVGNAGQPYFNTAREIFERINGDSSGSRESFSTVCDAAKRYAESISKGIPVTVYLVSYEGDIIARSE